MEIGVAVFILMLWECIVISYCLFMLVSTSHSVRTRPLLLYMGTWAYRIAYGFSLLRTPLGLVPYLLKLWLHLGLKIRYEARHTTYAREVLNMICEIVNLVITWELVWWLVGPLRLQWWVVLCYLSCLAECIRLLAERIPILFSAAWQLFPHRSFACWLQQYTSWPFMQHYCRYYCLSDIDRAAVVLKVLKQKAALDPEVARRLEYVHAFRIVPQRHGLRGGHVRDVAQGEVFIHAIWTNDPWLLIGMALRRSPWPFDPRYLQRPFYYMSEANRVTSLFVLQHARYSPSYAVFQFGHEIRVARLHFFYVLLRLLGFDIERKVWANGTFQNDQCIFWLKRQFHKDNVVELRPLYNDEEVLSELRTMASQNTFPTAQEIATRYVYPLVYVQEVLLPKMHQALNEVRC